MSQSVWPLVKFRFAVDFGGGRTGSFQEVSGLDSHANPIEYRHGNSPSFYPIKMPGLGRVGNVTMRKGIFVNDNKFWAWYDELKLNTIARGPMAIRLLDEAGKPAVTWTLNNAWPTKLTTTDLKSEGNEVAVESVDVAFETMVIGAP